MAGQAAHWARCARRVPIPSPKGSSTPGSWDFMVIYLWFNGKSWDFVMISWWFNWIQWDFMVSWWDSMDMCNAFLGGFHRFVLMGIVDIQWKLFDAMYWYLIAFFRMNGDFMLAGEKPLDTLKSPNLQSSTLDSPGCFGTVVPLLSINHQRNPTVDI